MVEGTGLENRRAVKGTEGSNPSLSAKNKDDRLVVFILGWGVSPPLFLGIVEQTVYGIAYTI